MDLSEAGDDELITRDHNNVCWAESCMPLHTRAWPENSKPRAYEASTLSQVPISGVGELTKTIRSRNEFRKADTSVRTRRWNHSAIAPAS